MKKRLTINSDLQIFFDDNDKAKFHSVKGATVEAVKAELIEWQAFVQTWLDEAEEPKPERLNLAQQHFAKQIRPLARAFRRMLKYDSQKTKEMLLYVLEDDGTEAHFGLSREQINAVVDSVSRDK